MKAGPDAPCRRPGRIATERAPDPGGVSWSGRPIAGRMVGPPRSAPVRRQAGSGIPLRTIRSAPAWIASVTTTASPNVGTGPADSTSERTTT